MSEPPRIPDRGQDFRTLPEDHRSSDEAILDALIRDVRARQSTVRALMEEEDEATGVPLVGSARATETVPSLVAGIRNAIQFDLEDFRSAPDPNAAFAKLREAVERTGVFVLLIGDLGSHHTRLSVETFRGISLSDPIAPFVVINSNDARSAWSFTLIHELTHLCLGQTGISGPWSEIEIEQRCNDVASEFLLATYEIETLQLPSGFELAAYQQRISDFARQRNISGTMVAYRLFRQDALSHTQWIELQARFREMWNQGAREQRARNGQSNGGPNYYVVRRHRVGSHLVDFVGRMLQSGALTTSKAGQLLGVKAGNVHNLVDPAP